MKNNKIVKYKDFLIEKIEGVTFERDNKNNVVAILNGVKIGCISLNNYWTEISYIEDEETLSQIKIPENYEYVGMITSDIENNGVATDMFKYAIETTKKKGIVVSTLFIADQAVHTIMKKLNADNTDPDWYILDKK